MKFATGIILGILLTFASMTLYGQHEREFHPRLARAIESLRDARAYMEEARHDFGGHRAAAIRACDDAIRQLELARGYRPR
jgi:hypothetical protein